MVDSDKAHSELLKPVFKTSSISKMTRLDSDHMCTGRPCKVSHFKQSSEKFILHYKCSHNMKCWHEKNCTGVGNSTVELPTPIHLTNIYTCW